MDIYLNPTACLSCRLELLGELALLCLLPQVRVYCNEALLRVYLLQQFHLRIAEKWVDSFVALASFKISSSPLIVQLRRCQGSNSYVNVRRDDHYSLICINRSLWTKPRNPWVIMYATHLREKEERSQRRRENTHTHTRRVRRKCLCTFSPVLCIYQPNSVIRIKP